MSSTTMQHFFLTHTKRFDEIGFRISAQG